jgi:hypothetical protein
MHTIIPTHKNKTIYICRFQCLISCIHHVPTHPLLLRIRDKQPKMWEEGKGMQEEEKDMWDECEWKETYMRDKRCIVANGHDNGKKFSPSCSLSSLPRIQFFILQSFSTITKGASIATSQRNSPSFSHEHFFRAVHTLLIIKSNLSFQTLMSIFLLVSQFKWEYVLFAICFCVIKGTKFKYYCQCDMDHVCSYQQIFWSR